MICPWKTISDGPYLLLHFEYIGTIIPANNGNVCEIIVDGDTITPPTEGSWDGMTMSANKNYIGRDGSWKPFILAKKTLEIKMRMKVSGGGGDVATRIMRFGE